MSLPHGCFADLHNATVSQEGHNGTLRLHSNDALLNPCGSNPIFIDVEDEWDTPGRQSVRLRPTGGTLS